MSFCLRKSFDNLYIFHLDIHIFLKFAIFRHGLSRSSSGKSYKSLELVKNDKKNLL